MSGSGNTHVKGLDTLILNTHVKGGSGSGHPHFKHSCKGSGHPHFKRSCEGRVWATVVQEVEKSVSNQKVASSIPCRSVLEQDTEPLIAPDVQCAISVPSM